MNIKVGKIILMTIIMLLSEIIIILFSKIELGGQIYNYNTKGETWYLYMFIIILWVMYFITKKWMKKEVVILYIVLILYMISHFIGYINNYK